MWYQHTTYGGITTPPTHQLVRGGRESPKNRESPIANWQIALLDNWSMELSIVCSGLQQLPWISSKIKYFPIYMRLFNQEIEPMISHMPSMCSTTEQYPFPKHFINHLKFLNNSPKPNLNQDNMRGGRINFFLLLYGSTHRPVVPYETGKLYV